MKSKKNNHCICGMCSFYKSGYGCTLGKTKNEKLQKQADLLTLGLLQEKGKVAELEKKLKEKVVYFNKQIEDLYDMAHRARKEGHKEGLCKYAWWKDGIQYVGTGGTTLKQALKETKK